MTRRLAIAIAAILWAVVPATRLLGADAGEAKMPRVGYKATDFTLDTLNGEPVTLSKVLAESPVVLVVLRGYPGYQCPICMVQVADFLKHADEIAALKAKVLFVYPGPAENLDQRAAEFIKNRNLPEHFVFVTDPDYRFTNAYGLRWDAPRETAYPSTFVIDGQATVRLAEISKEHGGRTKAEAAIKALPGAD